jgi:NADH-quinone oxidoreductase subunit J
VVCAINVVLQTHPISSALSLIGVMGSLAVLYLLLGASSSPWRRSSSTRAPSWCCSSSSSCCSTPGGERRGRSWTASARAFRCCSPSRLIGYLSARFPDARSSSSANFTGGTAQDVGYALFTDYLLPFEVTSVLILIAILGAIVLARKEMD